MTHPQPFDVDEQTFITGPDDTVLDVDPIFAKRFADMYDDLLRHAPEDVRVDDDLPPRPSIAVPGLVYRDVPCGVLLFDGAVAIGGYLSCDLGLEEAYRGRGLGCEIVIERCLQDGCSPVWSLDRSSYSPAGLAAHRAAWRQVRAQGLTTAFRLARLKEMA